MQTSENWQVQRGFSIFPLCGIWLCMTFWQGGLVLTLQWIPPISTKIKVDSFGPIWPTSTHRHVYGAQFKRRGAHTAICILFPHWGSQGVWAAFLSYPTCLNDTVIHRWVPVCEYSNNRNPKLITPSFMGKEQPRTRGRIEDGARGLSG